VRERGRAQGIFFAGAHLVAGGTPFLVLQLLPFMSWRLVFVCFGSVGLVWVAIWHTWFRNDPSEHPAVNKAELQKIVAERPPETSHHERVPWGRLIRNRNMVALCVMYTPNCMIFYFCITWLPTYLKAHGLGPAAGAFASGLPLFLSMPGDLAGGWLTDWLCARYGFKVGRCQLGLWAYLVAGACILGAALTSSPLTAAVLISIATGVTMFTLGAAWGTVIEVGRNHVGVVGATMNSTGNLIAMLNPLIVGYSVQWFNSWNLPLYVMGVLFLIGAFCWSLIDPTRPVFDEDPAADTLPANVVTT